MPSSAPLLSFTIEIARHQHGTYPRAARWSGYTAVSLHAALGMLCPDSRYALACGFAWVLYIYGGVCICRSGYVKTCDVLRYSLLCIVNCAGGMKHRFIIIVSAINYTIRITNLIFTDYSSKCTR